MKPQHLLAQIASDVQAPVMNCVPAGFEGGACTSAGSVVLTFGISMGAVIFAIGTISTGAVVLGLTAGGGGVGAPPRNTCAARSLGVGSEKPHPDIKTSAHIDEQMQ